MKYEGQEDFGAHLFVFKCRTCEQQYGFIERDEGEKYMWFHMVAC